MITVSTRDFLANTVVSKRSGSLQEMINLSLNKQVMKLGGQPKILDLILERVKIVILDVEAFKQLTFCRITELRNKSRLVFTPQVVLEKRNEFFVNHCTGQRIL